MDRIKPFSFFLNSVPFNGRFTLNRNVYISLPSSHDPTVPGFTVTLLYDLYILWTRSRSPCRSVRVEGVCDHLEC